MSSALPSAEDVELAALPPAGSARRDRWRDRGRAARVVGPPFGFLLLFFVLPLLLMFVYSFGELQGFDIHLTWTLHQYQEIVDNPGIRNLLVKSVRIAAEVTVITLLVSYPIAFAIARLASRRWQTVLLMLIVIPSWTSFIIRTYSWLLVLGDRGLINRGLDDLGVISSPIPLAFNEVSVIIALVYISIPWMVLPIFVSLEKMDWSLIEAAQALGATKAQIFRRVIWPITLPGTVAGSLMVFVPAISTFAIPEILGGSKGYMYGNLVDFQFQQLNWPFGAALCVVMLAVTGVLVAVLSRFVRFNALWTR